MQSIDLEGERSICNKALLNRRTSNKNNNSKRSWNIPINLLVFCLNYLSYLFCIHFLTFQKKTEFLRYLFIFVTVNFIEVVQYKSWFEINFCSLVFVSQILRQLNKRKKMGLVIFKNWVIEKHFKGRRLEWWEIWGRSYVQRFSSQLYIFVWKTWKNVCCVIASFSLKLIRYKNTSQYKMHKWPLLCFLMLIFHYNLMNIQ